MTKYLLTSLIIVALLTEPTMSHAQYFHSSFEPPIVGEYKLEIYYAGNGGMTRAENINPGSFMGEQNRFFQNSQRLVLKTEGLYLSGYPSCSKPNYEFLGNSPRNLPYFRYLENQAIINQFSVSFGETLPTYFVRCNNDDIFVITVLNSEQILFGTSTITGIIFSKKGESNTTSDDVPK